MEIAGLFQVIVTAKPGVELGRIEKAIDEELQKFLAGGPTKNELTRIKNQYRARFIRGMERIGGFGGKSDILATNMTYAGTPDFYKTTLDRVQKATAADLKNAAVKWLSDGDYVLQITPFPSLTTTAVDGGSLEAAGAGDAAAGAVPRPGASRIVERIEARPRPASQCSHRGHSAGWWMRASRPTPLRRPAWPISR